MDTDTLKVLEFETVLEQLTDRQLLEAICRQLNWLTQNALTPDTLVNAAEEKLPELLAKFDGNPLIKTVLKFL